MLAAARGRADPDSFLPLFRRSSLPSIRSKLFVLVFASVLPIVLGYIAFVRDAGQREREHVARDAATVARALVAALDRELESAESAARVAAAWPTLDAGSLAQFHAHARELLRPEFPAHAFVLTGPDGQPLLSTRIPFGSRLPPGGNRASVRKVFERGDAITSGLYSRGPGQAPVISADVPVWRNGKVVFVLSAELRPRRIGDLLGAQQLPPGWVAEVFDNHGLVVARNLDQSRHLGGRMNAALQAALQASPEGAVKLAGQPGEPDWYSVYSRSGELGWTVVVTYPEDAARELLGHTLPATVAGSVALLGLSLVLAWGIGGTIARSVRRLSEPAAALGRGEPLRLAPPNIRETAVVADALRQVEGELLRYRSRLESLVADRTAELERLHARVETVYATAPVGLCFVDRDLRFVMINDYLAAINAVPAEAHIGHTLPELLGEVGVAFEEAYRRVRDTGRPLRDIESTGAVPAWPGVMRSWLASYYPVYGPARELVGINAVVIDITDRKLLEQQNRDNEEMFRVLFEASGDAQALLAYNANFVSANAAAATLFGYDDVDDFLALTPAGASPEFQPNGRRSEEMAIEKMREALDLGGTQFEWVHQRRDGSNFHADIMLTRLDIGGRGMMQVTIRDISARVAADAALRASGAQLRQRERFIRTVTDNLPALVSYWDADGKLRFANRPCLAWLGRREQDAIGHHADELIPPEYNERFAPYFAGVLAGVPQRFECELPPKDQASAGGPEGEPVHVWGSYLPDVDRDGRVRGAYKLHMNVTDLKRTEGRLVQALREAEQASRAKSEFLGNMSHEIRTPMNAIMGLARLLEEAPLGRRERGHVAHMKTAARSLLGLLSDLLDYSRIESGQLALERVAFRLDDALRSIATLSAPGAWAKGLEPVFAVDPGVPEQLLGDPMRVEQVLLNLVGNAVKFTERGEVVLAVELVAHTESTVRLRFVVRDTGIGIAPEVQQRMFEPFSQGDNSTSRKYGGAGLGLSIARRLAGLMGGELGVDSQPGAGASFHVELEFGVAEAAAPAGPERLRVLVVDDNPSAGAALRCALAGFGWEAACAASGIEALALLREGPRFDLAFVDAAMPELDGITLLAYARADAAIDLPPTALLAADPEKERLAALSGDLALDAVLGKPFTRATLRETVAELRGGVTQVPAPAAPLGARLAGLRVLVVEDNPINQEVANYVLVHAGATVDLAANGRIALSMLAEPGARYDAVLMDLQMPVMNGFEASAAIRAMGTMGATATNGAALPIVAMSANAMEEDRRRALAAGMDEHLAKPIDVDELVATLERVTGSGASARRGPPPVLPALPAPPLLPGIDLKATLPRFGGSYAAFAAVFRRFALTQGEAVNEIRAQLAQGERLGAARLAHRLRGVAANLGANEVAAQSLRLEEALRGADDAQLALRLADLGAAMAQVAEIARELAPAAPESGSEAQALPDKVRAGALAELLELLQNNNMKAMSAYEALRPALASMLAPADAAALQEAVGTLRFEQAAQQVRAILVAKGDS